MLVLLFSHFFLLFLYHYIKSYWNLPFQFWIIYADLLDFLYKILLAIYFNDCNNITADIEVKIDKNCDPSNLFFNGYKYDKWYKKDEGKSKSNPEDPIPERLKGDDEGLSDISPFFVFNFGLKMQMRI